jgi:hypothetical protein
MKSRSEPSRLGDEGLTGELHRSRGLRDAPDAAIERVIDVFKPRAKAAPASLPSMLQRVWASLRYDSAVDLMLSQGVRSTAAASRQLLYSAEGRDIDLRIVPMDGRAAPDGGPWVIFGQVLGPDLEGVVELRQDDKVRRVPLDEMLEFRFDDVPGGSMRLALHLKGLLIDLPLDVPLPLDP